MFKTGTAVLLDNTRAVSVFEQLLNVPVLPGRVASQDIGCASPCLPAKKALE